MTNVITSSNHKVVFPIIQDAGHYVCEVDVGLGGQAREVRHQLQILGELSAKRYNAFCMGSYVTKSIQRLIYL